MSRLKLAEPPSHLLNGGGHREGGGVEPDPNVRACPHNTLITISGLCPPPTRLFQRPLIFLRLLQEHLKDKEINVK